ncbi:MAG: redoxin domain-containing protein [Gemmatimonadetes bacterium]|nr:redoxin domain-containing protein [Gemmatimonadota bacterium]
MRTRTGLRGLTLVLTPLALACAAEDARLGPTDGRDLPRTDLERVAVGTPAPDFTLAAYEGDPVRLSDLRGRPIVLVFYRGHW